MVRRIKAKLVLQLRAEGVTGRAIAAAQGMSRKSVLAVFDAADRAGLSWDSIAGKSDAEVSMRACSRNRTGSECIASSPVSG